VKVLLKFSLFLDALPGYCCSSCSFHTSSLFCFISIQLWCHDYPFTVFNRLTDLLVSTSPCWLKLLFLCCAVSRKVTWGSFIVVTSHGPIGHCISLAKPCLSHIPAPQLVPSLDPLRACFKQLWVDQKQSRNYDQSGTYD
jgi:hypothetical protein